MPDSVITSWVHGASMQPEYENRLVSVRHVGPFTRIEGQPHQNTWIHFPIPTPAVAGNRKPQASAVILNFRTRTSHAWVHEVVVYDGAATIAEHKNLHLSGEHPAERFEVPNNPEVQFALNVAVGVMFSPIPPNIQATWMEFIAAGCEFLRQPARTRRS